MYWLCIILLLPFLYEGFDNYISGKYVPATSDGRVYRIIGKYNPNTHTHAANMLARLNKFNIELMRHLRKKYVWSSIPHSDEFAKIRIEKLINRYDPLTLYENSPLTTKNTSYVQNKGDYISVCLREKSSGSNNLHSFELLQFVIMHELAHIMTKTYGHDKQFWRNFKFLINESVEANLYKPVNYAKRPTKYCGLNIDYSPYFDPFL